MSPAHKLPPYCIPCYTNGVLTVRKIDPETERVWPTLSQALSKKTVRPILFTDPKFQFSTLFYLACKENAIPAVIGNPHNMPFTRTMILKIQPSMLVSNPDLALSLLRNMVRHDINNTFQSSFLFGGAKEDIEKIKHEFPNIHIIESTDPLIV